MGIINRRAEDALDVGVSLRAQRSDEDLVAAGGLVGLPGIADLDVVAGLFSLLQAANPTQILVLPLKATLVLLQAPVPKQVFSDPFVGWMTPPTSLKQALSPKQALNIPVMLLRPAS